MSIKSEFPFKICHECLNSVKEHERHKRSKESKNRKPHSKTEEQKRHQFALEQEKSEIDENLVRIGRLVKSVSQTVNDHFEEVRREINLKREMLLREVHNKSNESIRRANLEEESLYKKLNEKILDHKIEFENENKTLTKLMANGKLDLMQIDDYKRKNIGRLNSFESFLLGSGLSREFFFKSISKENQSSLHEKVIIL